MSTETPSAYDMRLRDVAEDYRRRGYRVMVEPSVSQLPEFLRSYHPDLIAESLDESVFVELKSSGTASEKDDWAQLAETVRQHPGWRLELVLGTDRDRLAAEPIPRAEVEGRLEQGLRLGESEMLDAALLLTWSATEAAMRLASHKQQVELPDYRPAAMISRLYTDGIISREDYESLMRFMRLRDAVGHGLRHEAYAAADIRQLHRLTRRLLKQA